MLRSPVPEVSAAALRPQVLASAAALAGLRAEWEDLWAQDATATPFQSPAWLLPWWKHIGRGELVAVAVRCTRSGELLGLAPLYIHEDARTGQRQLLPLGIATTDDLDLLARPGCEEAVARTVLQQLATLAHRWEVLELPQLRPGSPWLRAPAPGWQREILRDEPHPVLSLLGGPAPLPLPRGMAANLRTCRNRAKRAGTVRFEQADARSWPDFLEALFTLHGRRWALRGLPGVLADRAVQDGHADAVPQLLAAGLLRLHALRVDGAFAAVLYCLADPPQRTRRRCYYYIGGFDPRFAALGPGTLLVAHAIEEARREGATSFDFLRGAEAYKYRWGAVDQPMLRLRARCGAGS